MDDFKLKMVIAILSSIVFAFIFILLAFAMPIEKKEQNDYAKAIDLRDGISKNLK